jgi:hypothetical protein
MHAIDEQQLNEYAANNVITLIKIKEVADNHFSLLVTLSWREGDCILTSARKSPRVWASLNTMAKYLKGINGAALPVQLYLLPPEEIP